jgi:hypothetical protein
MIDPAAVAHLHLRPLGPVNFPGQQISCCGRHIPRQPDHRPHHPYLIPEWRPGRIRLTGWDWVAGVTRWVGYRSDTPDQPPHVWVARQGDSYLCAAMTYVPANIERDHITISRRIAARYGFRPISFYLDELPEVVALPTATLVVAGPEPTPIKPIALEDDHLADIADMRAAGFTTLVHKTHVELHSCAIKHIYPGFETLSPGLDPATPNACAYPLVHGTWLVYRFGPEQEHPSWTKNKIHLPSRSYRSSLLATSSD